MTLRALRRIRISIKIKNQLFTLGDTNAYKTYKKIEIVLKKVWGGIKSVLGRKNKAHKVITSLKCLPTKQVSHNSSEFPDLMNKYFSSVGYNLASKMSHPFQHFPEYLPQVNSAGSFFFNPVSSSEIEREIMAIPQNKSHGLYSFLTHILR